MNRRWAAATACLTAFVLAVGCVVADEGKGSEAKGSKTKAESAKSAAEEGSTLTQALQGDSGVVIQTMCTNCNSADLSLGGFDAAYVDMVCDGLPVPTGLAQVYLLGILPPTVIHNIEVEKGAGRARSSGAAVGGEIRLERAQAENPFTGLATLEVGGNGWRGARAHLASELGWFRGTLVATYGESDIVDDNADDNPDMPEFDRRTVEARGRIAFNRDHLLDFGATFYDESQVDGPAAPYAFGAEPGADRGPYNVEDVELERTQFDLRYEGFFKDGSQLSLGAVRAERESDILETFQGRESQRVPTYFIDEDHDHAELSWSRAFGSKVLFRAGGAVTERQFAVVDVRYNIFPLGLGFEDALTHAQHEDVEEMGAWAEGQWTVGSKVDLALGLRYVDYDYKDEEDRPQWLDYDLPIGDKFLPRIALTYKPNSSTTLRLSAGTGYRQPEPSYEEVCCGRRYRGNRGIGMEESTSFGLEWTYQPDAKFRVGASAFFTDYDNMLANIAVLAYQYQPTYQNVNVPEARTTSFGFNVRFDATNWLTLRASATWLDAENRTPGGEIPALLDFFGNPNEYVFEDVDEIPYLTELTATLGADVRLSKRASASVTAQYTGEMLIQRFDAGFSGVIGSELNQGFFPTDKHWVVNLYTSYDLGGGFSLFAGVDNIGDYIQEDLGIYTTDYNWGPLRGRYAYGGMTYRFGN